MTFGPARWLRPEERADVGTPPLVLVQSVIASGSLATTAMLVSLGASALVAALFASGPILDSDSPLRGVLMLPALAVLLVALARETVRKVNLKQA